MKIGDFETLRNGALQGPASERAYVAFVQTIHAAFERGELVRVDNVAEVDALRAVEYAARLVCRPDVRKAMPRLAAAIDRLDAIRAAREVTA